MSLYLKYRPQDFKNLVGQSFIKDTLSKAIETNKTVGAYVFTGPRGTGKTSTARIFAKAVNCLQPTKGNPCLSCDVCKGFIDNKLIDIIEIDAASHTGVDNIREIIEKAQFQPTQTKYKIYIIDEVHMLSKGAFNALLKILEEPPAHVKFILATTEIHKVPETILSRCQRYDFKSITPDDVRERLQFIADAEKVSIDRDALEYIIKSANGGLRNAISLFEQLIVEGQVSYQNIESTLGVSKHEEVQNFANTLVNRDLKVMKEFQKLEDSGKNLKLFFRDVLLFLGEQAKIEIQKGNDISGILRVLDVLHDTYGKSKNSFDENLTFQIGVMKILSQYTEEKVNVIPAKAGINKIETVPLPSDRFLPSQEGRKDVKEGQKQILNQVQDDTINKQKKVPEPKAEQLEHTPQIQELLIDEAQHVFSVDEPVFDQEVGASDSQPHYETQSFSNFDKNIFIDEVKKLGAKGGTTMSLRGAQFSLDGDVLSITCKTKFALGTINSPEDMEFLYRALESLKIDGLTIKIS